MGNNIGTACIPSGITTNRATTPGKRLSAKSLITGELIIVCIRAVMRVNLSLGLPARSDTNWAVQPQKMA